MRVLHAYKVFRPDVDGGVPAVITTAASGSAPEISSRILVARGQAGLGRSYEDNGASVRAVASLGNCLGMPIAPGFPIALAAEARKADLVALHLPFPLNDIGALGIPSRLPIVVHWHADVIGRRMVARALEPLFHRTLRRAARIIVADNAIVESSDLLGAYRTKCEAVPFGIDTSDWGALDPEQSDRAQRLRERNPRLVVALGRLVAYKGFDVLVRALRQLDCHLLIIGTGTQQKHLESLAGDLGVRAKISFVGYLSQGDVKVHLHAARVFAFPSITRAETFGIAQLEAMAAGLPIVNTSIPTAVPRIARNGIEALTVPQGDVAALSAAISRLLDDEALASRLGTAGRERAREAFDRQLFLARLNRIYHEVHEASCS
jgi:glycosyltransferase involved in cell wall biosynthesis